MPSSTGFLRLFQSTPSSKPEGDHFWLAVSRRPHLSAVRVIRTYTFVSIHALEQARGRPLLACGVTSTALVGCPRHPHLHFRFNPRPRASPRGTTSGLRCHIGRTRRLSASSALTLSFQSAPPSKPEGDHFWLAVSHRPHSSAFCVIRTYTFVSIHAPEQARGRRTRRIIRIGATSQPQVLSNET